MIRLSGARLIVVLAQRASATSNRQHTSKRRVVIRENSPPGVAPLKGSVNIVSFSSACPLMVAPPPFTMHSSKKLKRNVTYTAVWVEATKGSPHVLLPPPDLGRTSGVNTYSLPPCSPSVAFGTQSPLSYFLRVQPLNIHGLFS